MKSNVSQLLDLGLRILQDAAAKCYTAKVADWPRDFKTMKSRVKREGMSFLTITLPSFGAEFEKALHLQKVDSTFFAGWRKRGCLPAFLRGFTSQVFAPDGCLMEEPDVAAIEGIRQICYAFKKILLPCTQERAERAIQAYLQMEQELTEFAMPASSDLFTRVASLLWGDVFGSDIDTADLIPKHGPGATAEGIKGNSKFLHRTWHERLQPCFPADEYIAPNTLLGISMLDDVEFIQEGDELPVKVTLVPKTLKTPRIIAIEPVCMQYTQQALLGYLVDRLSSHWLTGGHINFTDQSVNQELALIASRTGQLATLDLSSASDRVPLLGVERMLEVNPDLLGCLLASRSTHAEMPDGTIIPLAKFASMGSATCFPVEAMYFYTCIMVSLVEQSGRPLTFSLLKELGRDVYVYGDDLIVPADAVEGIIQTLADYNCKVGLSKSFWTGKFRESCGVEAYDGEYVTPTYIRRLKPNDARSASEVSSWVATSNQFYTRGYWKTADYMRRTVEHAAEQRLPLVLEKSPGLGWVNYQQGYSVHRWNLQYCRYEVKTLIPSPVYYKDVLDDVPALMKFLLSSTKRGSELPEPISITKVLGIRGPTQTEIERLYLGPEDLEAARLKDHLHRSARYGAVSMKSRWTTPY